VSRQRESSPPGPTFRALHSSLARALPGAGEAASSKSFANLAAALWNRSCTGMWNRAPSLATAILTLCHGRQARYLVITPLVT